MAGEWIIVKDWDRFQHYRKRRPVWIKLYVELVDDPAYLELGISARILLIELWMLYAVTRGQVQADVRFLSRRLRHRVTSDQLKSLSHAGFIAFSASRPLAYKREEKRKEENRGFGVFPTLPSIPPQRGRLDG